MYNKYCHDLYKYQISFSLRQMIFRTNFVKMQQYVPVVSVHVVMIEKWIFVLICTRDIVKLMMAACSEGPVLCLAGQKLLNGLVN